MLKQIASRCFPSCWCFELRVPLNMRRTDLNKENLSFVFKWFITWAYCSPLLSAIFVATRFIKVLHSFPIPPCVENTYGTNVAFSILIIRTLYALFLLLSLSAYTHIGSLLTYSYNMMVRMDEKFGRPLKFFQRDSKFPNMTHRDEHPPCYCLSPVCWNQPQLELKLVLFSRQCTLNCKDSLNKYRVFRIGFVWFNLARQTVPLLSTFLITNLAE